jgi:hypothetical protein
MSTVLSADRGEKLISLAALVISIELVLFKFLPDVSTAVVQHLTSSLTDFTAFELKYMTPGSVYHSRFLGNYILYDLARLLGHVVHSDDPRLHPLRMAAGIVTPVYALLGACFVLRDGTRMAWRYFLVPYALVVLMGLYVFYPGDMPSFACLSLALWALLDERRVAALLLMLVTGLFRESAFHMVWLVAAWAACASSRSLQERLVWPGLFALAFVLEYVAIRHFFPGPVSSAGGVILDPRRLFLDKGLLSLTTLCSLGLASLFPVACLLAVRDISYDDWRRTFFKLNCYVFPAWIVFYRMMNGNIAEFRMLLPAILPCLYGIAYSKGTFAWPRNASVTLKDDPVAHVNLASVRPPAPDRLAQSPAQEFRAPRSLQEHRRPGRL